MRFRRLVLVAVCLCLPLLPARAEDDGVPLPERNPLREAKPVAAPVEEKKPLPPSEQASVPWTEAEIDAAKAKCKELLTGDPLDYELLPPIKEGVCGTPAPVLLRSVGTDQKVLIVPPATMSCPMADVLGEWLRDTVQPEAMKLFGSPVVKIQNASSYVCRNRYGGAATPLSEHALANAFDVSEFVLADGTRITVLDDWPKPQETPPPPVANPNRAPAAHAESAAAKAKPEDRAKDTHAAKTGGVMAAHAKSPDEAASPAETKADLDPKTRFVVFLHEDACKRFGTVLGPEANAAHKNHFHLDMKTRRKGFCE
jgi:hypothetical protein